MRAYRVASAIQYRGNATAVASHRRTIGAGISHPTHIRQSRGSGGRVIDAATLGIHAQGR